MPSLNVLVNHEQVTSRTKKPLGRRGSRLGGGRRLPINEPLPQNFPQSATNTILTRCLGVNLGILILMTESKVSQRDRAQVA